MSKHTPGPWAVKESPFCISVESEDDILSELYLSDEDDAYAQEHARICRANARLIAAAPAACWNPPEFTPPAEPAILPIWMG